MKEVIGPELLGVYINPDDIEKDILNHNGILDLKAFGIETSTDEALSFFKRSSLLTNAGLLDAASNIHFNDNKLDFSAAAINSYFASVASDFIRRKLLDQCQSFTFETVMSSKDKIELLCLAQAKGYRTYLYYVATEAPEINVSRVRHRVKAGGHPVPEDKIASRYYRSLDLLESAVACTHRAYIFDNSGRDRIWIAEIIDGESMKIRCSQIPSWFRQALWEKF